MSKKQKFIVWDWNGTLLDDTDIVLECINIALTKTGCAPVSMETLRNNQEKSFVDFYLSQGMPKKEVDYLRLHGNDVFHDNYESRANHAPLRKGAVVLLRKLKKNNVSNVILSNHIANEIVRLLKQHDIHGLFDKVMGFASRDEQFRSMTKSERLRHHIESEELASSNALIIGDTREEIEIGHELGIGSVAITGGLLGEHHLRAMKPDYVVHSLDELAPIIQERGFAA
jgi:phosphoglycolate phosphatase